MTFGFAFPLARAALFKLDPEAAHALTMKSLNALAAAGASSLVAARIKPDPRSVMGLQFANPVGLAAGADKNGECIAGFGALGFGFMELGGVTPRSQPGNPKPRVFRLVAARGIINRLGFNNFGVDFLVERLKSHSYKGVIGINLGKNLDTPLVRAADDYAICYQKVYPYAGFATINISSPNTKNLRQLQGASELDALLSQLKAAQSRLADQYKRYVPITLKIAPDIDTEQAQNIAGALLRHKIDGVIATNTTLARNAVEGMEHGAEAGGLSGAPVFELSNIVIRKLKSELGDELPIIGVGGIMCGADAKAKFDAGASLVQLYSGLIYAGPALVRDCARALKGT